jgi:hypothetical protein
MLPFSSLNPMSLGKTELTRTHPFLFPRAQAPATLPIAKNTPSIPKTIWQVASLLSPITCCSMMRALITNT